MKNQTSYSHHKATIDLRWRDAIECVRMGLPNEAQRLRLSIALLRFDGCTTRERALLVSYSRRANMAISDMIGGLSRCTP